MKYYKLTIKLVSSFSTPLVSDTIWGHICWALRFLKGGEELKRFISSYSNCKEPPLLISNAFPKDFLPRPILSPIKKDQRDSLRGEFYSKDPLKSEILNFEEELKIYKKAKYISWEDYEIFKENASELNYYKILMTKDEEIKKLGPKPIQVTRNTINRLSGTTMQEGGGLYFSNENFFDDENERNIYNIYLAGDYFNKDELLELLIYIKENGYGKDSSSGKGRFDIISDLEEIKWPEFMGDAILSLSDFVLSEKDPVKDGWYALKTKFGKLGSIYANSGNPFKYPLLMITAGSVFWLDKSAKYLGKLVHNIHPQKDICHYGYALCLPINIEVN